MKKTKLAALAVLGVSLGIGATSVLAKAHDMGVADGTRGVVTDNGEEIQTGVFSRGGAVSRIVVGDPGQTYGQSVASVAKGANRVNPVVVPGSGPKR